MKNMTLKEIAVACGGIYYGDDESYYKEVSRRSGPALCVRSPKNGLKMPLIHTFWSPPVNRH